MKDKVIRVDLHRYVYIKSEYMNFIIRFMKIFVYALFVVCFLFVEEKMIFASNTGIHCIWYFVSIILLCFLQDGRGLGKLILFLSKKLLSYKYSYFIITIYDTKKAPLPDIDRLNIITIILKALFPVIAVIFFIYNIYNCCNTYNNLNSVIWQLIFFFSLNKNDNVKRYVNELFGI